MLHDEVSGAGHRALVLVVRHRVVAAQCHAGAVGVDGLAAEPQGQHEKEQGGGAERQPPGLSWVGVHRGTSWGDAAARTARRLLLRRRHAPAIGSLDRLR